MTDPYGRARRRSGRSAAADWSAVLVPTLAFLWLPRLLDRLRIDVLVEHTVRMAADDGATAEDVVRRADPAVTVGSRRP
ncbi:hypothetical protein GRX01_07195 [Halobaculum sp. WSA2]|uniref:Uncharacterized protein n=1 Tax=Halobaculum saliterrae TaxID=2073113 RepID=A0A6B0SWU1_9EURY|nr:hypothetical protein [Halobaculum saliterrae]MXR41121.1 hypothetical protein [Halobaculum saliterrae]